MDFKKKTLLPAHVNSIGVRDACDLIFVQMFQIDKVVCQLTNSIPQITKAQKQWFYLRTTCQNRHRRVNNVRKEQGTTFRTNSMHDSNHQNELQRECEYQLCWKISSLPFSLISSIKSLQMEMYNVVYWLTQCCAGRFPVTACKNLFKTWIKLYKIYQHIIVSKEHEKHKAHN